MKPFHTTMASAIATIVITDNKIQAVGALGLAARLIASTRIPHDADPIFAAFSDKVEKLTADKIDTDILIMLTESIGDNVKTYIGVMDKDDLPTATFFKTQLDSLRDKVALIVPDAMHKIQNAVFAVRELDTRIKLLTPPASQIAEVGQNSQLADDIGSEANEHDIDPAIAAQANQVGADQQRVAELA